MSYYLYSDGKWVDAPEDHPLAIDNNDLHETLAELGYHKLCEYGYHLLEAIYVWGRKEPPYQYYVDVSLNENCIFGGYVNNGPDLLEVLHKVSPIALIEITEQIRDIMETIQIIAEDHPAYSKEMNRREWLRRKANKKS
jgi:hypothetical protein